MGKGIGDGLEELRFKFLLCYLLRVVGFKELRCMKHLEQCLAQGPSLQLFDMDITFCFIVDLVQRTDLAKG